MLENPGILVQIQKNSDKGQRFHGREDLDVQLQCKDGTKNLNKEGEQIQKGYVSHWQTDNKDKEMAIKH